MYKVEKTSDIKNARLLQETFPEIYRPYLNGQTLKEIATNIKSNQIKPVFQKYSISTLIKFLSIALQGGEYNNETLEGLIEDSFHQVKAEKARTGKGLKECHKKNGYTLWPQKEKEYIKQLYINGFEPRKIIKLYKVKFENSTKGPSNILSLIDVLRKKPNINKQRLEWDGNLGFFALALLELYGREGQYVKKNAKTLDDYFFKSKGRLTRKQLRAFYLKEAPENLDWDGNLGFCALSLLKRYGTYNGYIAQNVQTLNDFFFEGKTIITGVKLSRFYRNNSKIDKTEIEDKEAIAA